MCGFLVSFGKWAISHMVTTVFVLLHVLISVIYFIVHLSKTDATSISLNADISAPWNLLADSLDNLPFTILIALLLSGVEKSVGSFNYCFEMIFVFSFFFLFRQFFIPQPAGATFLVYTPFFTFILNHKPYYYFKIKSLSFTDTFFYSFLFIQYVLYDISPHLIDLAINIIALISWKIVVLLFHLCCGRNQRTNNENQQEI